MTDIERAIQSCKSKHDNLVMHRLHKAANGKKLDRINSQIKVEKTKIQALQENKLLNQQFAEAMELLNVAVENICDLKDCEHCVFNGLEERCPGCGSYESEINWQWKYADRYNVLKQATDINVGNIKEVKEAIEFFNNMIYEYHAITGNDYDSKHPFCLAIQALEEKQQTQKGASIAKTPDYQARIPHQYLTLKEKMEGI